MNSHAFLNQLEGEEIRAAIAKAERRTTGEIRVLVIHDKAEDPVAAAQARFRALRMHKTERRNGILIFVAPASQTFAVVGDVGVHALCGEEFWKSVRDEMGEHLKGMRYGEAIVRAVERAGELLAEHFPIGGEKGGKRNELPDTVIEE